ncbi:MAG: hypothetical protein AAGC68_17260, partial [Verrucomicrobiota bacterium]
MKSIVPYPILIASILFTTHFTLAEIWTEPLGVLSQVGPEGEGNVEAAAAWTTLTEEGTDIILPTLAAMGTASPLARNWMRTAVETVFDKGLSTEAELPADGIEAFLVDREN